MIVASDITPPISLLKIGRYISGGLLDGLLAALH